MKIVCISDTHSGHNKFEIPDGDILIHAGDISSRGKPEQIKKFNNWLGRLPHQYKIMIAGNHDFLFENEPDIAAEMITNAIYLNDSGIEIEGVKFWGSPITPWFLDWAFNRYRGEDIQQHWDKIPLDTDILITHGPPYGILDKTVYGQAVGCENLLEIVQKVQPKLHIFGHIHEAYGKKKLKGTTFINASLMDENYNPVHKAHVIEI